MMVSPLWLMVAVFMVLLLVGLRGDFVLLSRILVLGTNGCKNYFVLAAYAKINVIAANLLSVRATCLRPKPPWCFTSRANH